jgi:glycosyltransferase involved in cell wall biosynthesis
MLKLSVVIKAYNEEKNISRAIMSALAAVSPYHGEVIVADGASTDRTVEIALRYPVTVVTLRQPDRRCCGIGSELGFRHSAGEYVYILDGDMALEASFISKAVDYLDRHPEVAAVGGAVQETRAPNLEFRSRVNRLNRLVVVGEIYVNCLNGGGLYRRSSLLDVGYMSDQNLYGCEEYDLGARLRGKGWRIVRIADHAADHFAPQLTTLPLLWQRVRNRRFLSIGQVLRASIDAGYLTKLFGEMRVIQLAAAVWIYWLLGGSLVLVTRSAILAAGVVLLVPAAAVGAISYRHRAVALGCLSFVIWHLAAAGLLLGVFKKRVQPLQSIDNIVVVSRIADGQMPAAER